MMSRTNEIKSANEIKLMRKGGRIAAFVKNELVKAAKPGQKTLFLDQLAEKIICRKKAVPNFKNYHGYPCSIVTCINEQVVHGIPGEYKLKEGDLLTVDLGVCYQGFHSDTAITIEIKKKFPPKANQPLAEKMKNLEKEEFLKVGQKALGQAIEQVHPYNHVGDISFAIQKTTESAGYNVVRDFVGHGIGRELHEPPQIPCFGEKGKGEVLKPGMVLAIEVMYCVGSCQLKILKDGWTAVTADGSLSAMFEDTVAVTENFPLILTRL